MLILLASKLFGFLKNSGGIIAKVQITQNTIIGICLGCISATSGAFIVISFAINEQTDRLNGTNSGGKSSGFIK